MALKLKRTIGILLIILGLITPVFVSSLASAQVDKIEDGACGDITGQNTDCGGDPSESINSIIKTVINVLSFIVGVVAVIMIIIGGLKYITSSGDSGNIASAKNTILYAIVGLVVVALAQIIVLFVLDRASPVEQ